MINVSELREVLQKMLSERNTYWKRGVIVYALGLTDYLAEMSPQCITDHKNLEQLLLNGAMDWDEYSYGGCSRIYDKDIAKTLCTPSELKKKKFGELSPYKGGTWLDVQARALYQACSIIWNICKKHGYVLSTES